MLAGLHQAIEYDQQLPHTSRQGQLLRLAGCLWSGLNEISTQLLAETRAPLPTRPGRPRREDYEYPRAGTRNLFLTCEPRRGWRHVAITSQRTMQDFAHRMKWLVDEAYPDVPVVWPVLDNLSTHRIASLYETFPALGPGASPSGWSSTTRPSTEAG